MANDTGKPLEGIEGQFCSSWSGWDEIETACMVFYEAVLTPELASVAGLEVATSLVIDGNSCTVQVYDDDNMLLERKFKVVLDN